MAALCSLRGVPLTLSSPKPTRRQPRSSRVATGGGRRAGGGRDATGLSSLRFSKPTPADMEGLVQEWRSRQCNHEFAGASRAAPDGLPAGIKEGGGFMITKSRKQIGQGKAEFDAAVKAIRAWEHLQLGWNCTTSPPMAPGATICSATQTVVPWSVLPAQVIYCEEAAADFGSAGGQGRIFSLGLCSLSGHQLAGEERFQLELHADGSVWYDVFLFSRPDTLLAWASLPVVKLMQLRYVTDTVKAVAAAIKA